jgi:hypothetical protein
VPFILKQHSEWDEVYLRAATRLLNGGDVYRLEDGYAYPPFMAWAVIPFTFLSPLISRLVWFAINVACLVGMLRLAWRMTGGGILEGIWPTDTREHLICILGLACGLRYALNGIAHHQTDLVIGMALLGGCYLLSRGRETSAGSCFGLAAAMKCTAVLWVPYLLWRGKWKAATGVLLVAVGLNLLPNLARQPDEGGLWVSGWLTRYVHPLTSAERYPGDWGSWIIYNQSLSGAGNRWLTTQWGWRGSEFEVTRKLDALDPMLVKSIVYGFEAILVIVVVVVVSRRRALEKGQGEPPSWPSEIVEYCLVLVLMVLISPMSSKPHFATLILPGLMLARWAVNVKAPVIQLMLGMAIVMAALSLPLWSGGFDFIALWLGSDTWNAFILLIGCLYVLRQADLRTCTRSQCLILHARCS